MVLDERIITNENVSWKRIVDEMPEFVIIIDRDLRVLYLNHVQPGLTREEFLGREIIETAPPAERERIRNIYREVFDTGLNRAFEMQAPTGPGKIGYYSVTASPLSRDDYNKEISYLILISRDITEKKKAEGAQREAREKAELANRAKTEFLASMSHDIRTPLNAIVGLSQILLERIEQKESGLELPEEFREQLTRIHASGRGLSMIIGDILELAQIETGTPTLESADFSLIEMIHGLVDIYDHHAADRGVRLAHQVHAHVPPHVRTDRGKLMQIVGNLLNNAIKFSPAGGTVTLSVTTVSEKERIQFEIRDEGPGIDRERVNELFEPYRRGSAREIAGREGVGLGLAITRKLTDFLKGEILVDSVPGQGSSFRVLLPLARRELPPAPGPNHVLRSYPGRSILVVDDDSLNRKVLEAVMRRHELVVFFAETGEEAVSTAAEHRPDLVLMDLRLPGINGLEASRRILAARPDLPIVILSADAFLEQKRQAAILGVREYLTKPLEFRRLEAVLDRYLLVSGAQ